MDAGRQVRFQRHADATEIILVRHGESAAALPGDPWPYWERHGDPILHPHGELQAERVCARLAAEGVDAIVVSPLRRTQMTARRLAEATGLTPTVERGLAELFLGEWEGPQFRAYVKDGHPLAVRMAEERSWEMLPGAEPPAEFEARVIGAIRAIAERERGRKVAVFVHGWVISQVLSTAAQAHLYSFNASDNASISRIVVHGDRWTVRSYNDVCHLADLDG